MRKTIVGTALAIAGLLLAGCGGNDSMSGMAMSSSATAAAQPGAHNAADVTFVQEMIPHHRQAVAMAQLATARASNARVKDLAGRIERAQGPEIQQMTGWLTEWGVAPGGSMPGMMSDADMGKLRQAGGTEFDRMFLQMMVAHHQGAVDMAETELADGADADAKALARRISDSQTAEIAEMRQLLTGL
ncbi:DUF305 domain-containing protein [Amycolatopsis sp.]|uniref:DUF305 domain-containing protein n=1 Tax=Amycolatopsis sp. TaxID=37632 RepID=UPI002D126F0C|nr:DUF305 domain-containing protein [Amycolatopsis sp.]HVV12620.1 DUF305 domain-containing protein [Amycolatopsis sp.]